MIDSYLPFNLLYNVYINGLVVNLPTRVYTKHPLRIAMSEFSEYSERTKRRKIKARVNIHVQSVQCGHEIESTIPVNQSCDASNSEIDINTATDHEGLQEPDTVQADTT